MERDPADPGEDPFGLPQLLGADADPGPHEAALRGPPAGPSLRGGGVDPRVARRDGRRQPLGRARSRLRKGRRSYGIDRL